MVQLGEQLVVVFSLILLLVLVYIGIKADKHDAV